MNIDGQENEAKTILLGMKFIAPPVVFLGSPISYLSGGKNGHSHHFYKGLRPGQSSSDHNYNQIVNYCVIQPIYDLKEGDIVP